MVGMSAELKDAIGIAAQEADMSVAELVREAVAKQIDYDLEADEEAKVERRGRPKVYKDREDRKKARQERNKTRRALARQLVRDFKSQEHAEQLRKMAESVTNRELAQAATTRGKE